AAAAGIAALLLGGAALLVAAALRAARAPAVPAVPRSALFDAEERIHALNVELASLRGVQQELIAAKQAAEAAMLAKSEFLATMSHEIRTPLNGILPLLDIVLGTSLTPEQREYLGTAHRSAQELLNIVDDILDYSKIEAGKLELESVSLNLRDLGDSVLALMQRAAESKGLALRFAIDPEVRPNLRGDPVRLRQVLTNLVGNAIKFTERGGVSVRVSKRGDTRTHHEVLFAVRDTGIGIAPEVAERLFRPFTQADASVTRRYGGTGLGLTICKRLVEMMGGQIGVRSEPGRGSVFWFSVPLAKMPGDIPGTRHDLTGLRALVAADPATAHQLAPLLAGLGIQHSQVGGAAEALAQLRHAAPLGRSFAYELVVVDPATVRGDAQALVRNVLREPRLERVRVLLLGGGRADDGGGRVATLARVSDEVGLRAALQSLYDIADSRPAPMLTPVSKPPSPPPAAGDAPPRLNGRVLLVEDHPVNLQVASKLLSRLGLEVTHAAHGAEALEHLAQQRFDLVLMDCQMPVLDGYSATRELRRREAASGAPRLPVIAMTAHAMAGDRERCLDSGMDDYLTKPLDRALLAETLQRWLGARAVPAPQEDDPFADLPTAAMAAPEPPAAVPVPPPARPAASPAASAALASPPAAPRAPVFDEPILDNSVLDDLVDIMGDELRMLVQVFLNDSPQRLDGLHAAAAQGDIVGLSAHAHALKSASANLGARALSALAKSLELDARAGHVADPPARVAALMEAYGATATALRRRFAL
ncbi:hybrid sensor histidine kinase/response regulator, partial [Mizugakiibacter sediminis]|uniref:hybrid sensor histidine kinase/response regulator n=1 Tax=Mizugakiibacter sediminis TaxID=1475481 RepID=UPI000784364B